MDITVRFLSLVTLSLVFALPVAAQDNNDATGEEEVRWRPDGFTDVLTPYDLEEEFNENKKKEQEGKAHMYTSFLVKEFAEHYYPKAEFQWHRAAGAWARHVGIWNKDEHTVQEVFLHWQSYSDGLEWGFYNGELERTTQADRFAIIADAEVASKIKQDLLNKKVIGDLKDVKDVFSYRTRSFMTESKTSGLKFPDKDFGETKYGVSIGDKLHFYDAMGQNAK